MREIWFWQTIVSPHMAGFARALAREGCRVNYVAGCDLSDDRKRLGWAVPALDGVQLRFARKRSEVAQCVDAAQHDSVHLCQGLRANGLISYAQKHLAKRRLQQCVLMETIDDGGLLGPVKRAAYTALFRRHRERTRIVFATGHAMPDWVVSRGMPRAKVFPFAYFLEDRAETFLASSPPAAPFRFAFVGQFIERKRLPILLDALAAFEGTAELVVVGSGPLEQAWRAYAERLLPGRVRWMGGLPSAQVLELLGDIDCLVLPSRHDGWGAVVSEALMSGTPAICSDLCGAAGVVLASGVGGVFAHDDVIGLSQLLAHAMTTGKLSSSDRAQLADWATALGASAGARYLLEILAHVDGAGARPEAPWIRGTSPCAA